MSDRSQTADLLDRVRQRAAELAAQNRYEYCGEFGPPCFVDCPCWHDAEREIQNG